MAARNSRHTRRREQRALQRAKTNRPKRTFAAVLKSFLRSRRLRVVVLAAIGICSAWSGWYRLSLVAINAKVELTETGAVTLGYPTRGSHISPLCGCYNEIPRDVWSGIVFSGADALVRRRGERPFSVYHLIAPMPGEVTAFDSELFFQPVVYRIPRTAFNQNREMALSPMLASAIAGFESAQLPVGVTYIRGFAGNELQSLIGDAYRTRILTVVSDSPLHVVLDKHTPLAAYIPIDGSDVRIDVTRGMHLGSSPKGSIRESVTADLAANTLDAEGTVHVRRADLPIIDVLGRDVIFWIDDGNPALHDGYGTRGFSTSVADPYVTVIIPNAPFAVRVGIGNVTTKDAVEFYGVARLEKDTLSLHGPALLSVARDKSETTVEISGIDSAYASYERLRTNLTRDSVVFREIVTTGRYAYEIGKGAAADSGEVGRGEMVFRQPPIPKSAGISVFGTLAFLRIENARGKLLTGRKLHDLSPYSDLEFDHISRFSPKGGVFSIPFDKGHGPLEPSEIYSIESMVRVNGQPAYTRWEHYAWLYDYRLLVSLAALVLSLLGFWRSIKKPAKH